MSYETAIRLLEDLADKVGAAYRNAIQMGIDAMRMEFEYEDDD